MNIEAGRVSTRTRERVGLVPAEDSSGRNPLVLMSTPENDEWAGLVPEDEIPGGTDPSTLERSRAWAHHISDLNKTETEVDGIMNE